MLKAGYSVELVQNSLEFLRKLLPNMPSECPKKLPYRFEALKINMTDENHDASSIFQIPMANGVYRSVISFFSDDDPQGFKVEWFFEINRRMGSDVF